MTFTSKAVPLSSLAVGAHALVSGVGEPGGARVERLLALGITNGAVVTMLQTFPGVVFLCDQTELAVERAVADAILVRPMEDPDAAVRAEASRSKIVPLASTV